MSDAVQQPTFVALSDPDGESKNTLVLGLVDILLPLERDLDDDPDTPDSVRLRKEDGSYQVSLRADSEFVEQDGANDLLIYRFEDVPTGTYAIEVLVKTEWLPVVEGMVVTQEDLLLGSSSLVDEEFDGSVLGVPDDEWDEDPEFEDEDPEGDSEEDPDDPDEADELAHAHVLEEEYLEEELEDYLEDDEDEELD